MLLIHSYRCVLNYENKEIIYIFVPYYNVTALIIFCHCPPHAWLPLLIISNFIISILGTCRSWVRTKSKKIIPRMSFRILETKYSNSLPPKRMTRKKNNMENKYRILGNDSLGRPLANFKKMLITNPNTHIWAEIQKRVNLFTYRSMLKILESTRRTSRCFWNRWKVW